MTSCCVLEYAYEWQIFFEEKGFVKKRVCKQSRANKSCFMCHRPDAFYSIFVPFHFVDKHNYKAKKMYNHPPSTLCFQLFFPNLWRQWFTIVVFTTYILNNLSITWNSSDLIMQKILRKWNPLKCNQIERKISLNVLLNFRSY